MNLLTGDTTDYLCAICGGDHSTSNCSVFEITNHVPDNKVLSKARLTLPKIFKIETMADGNSSVLSTELIPKGTQFGPLEANRIFSLNPDISFPLKIFTNDEDDYFGEYYLNNINEHECNWMIFISAAQTYEEQNLICYQENEEIFYLAIRDIPAGEHLKVWYSPFYAKKMNKQTLERKVLEDVPRDAGIVLDISSLVRKQQNVQERETWNCKFCSIMESDVVKFAKHISDHYAMQLRNQCEYCNVTFKSQRSLQKHIKLKHSNGTLNHVNVSEKPEPTQKNNAAEKESVLGGPLLNDILSDSMDNTNVLLQQSDFEIGLTNQNMMLETENLNVDNLLSENVKELDHFNFEIDENQEQFICDICLKEFSKLKHLYLHLNKHTGRYTCEICKKIFARKENLLSHDCITPNQNFECTTCGKKFSLKKYLVRHIKCYHKKSYNCDKCNKPFKSLLTFNEHSCNEINTGQHKCELCGKVFLKDAYLRKHLKLHSEDRKKQKGDPPQVNIICEVCSSTFTTLTNYKVHVRTHSDPTFACDECDQKFHRKSLLENHKSTHREKTDEFKCPICDKNLKTKKYLKIHMKNHEPASYPCSDCPQTFNLKVNMKKHFDSIHKKKCTICNLTFTTHEDVLAHKAIHFDSFYSCPVCKRNVKLRSSLRRHIKKVHPEYDLSETKMSECRVLNSNNSKDAPPKDDVDDVSMDNEITQSIENEVNTNGHFVEVSKDKQIILSDNYESTDLSSLDVDDQIEKTIAMDQGDYDVDGFDDLDLKFEDSFTKNVDSTSAFSQSDLGIPITSNLEQTENILDFNNLEMELDRAFNSETELSAPVCVSMPHLVQDVALGDNAFILDNGTITEPRDQGNVVVYILDTKFDTNNGAPKHG